MHLKFTKHFPVTIKKIFAVAFLVLSLTQSSKGQVLYNQSFDNATYPPLPVGWASQNLGTTIGVLPDWIAGDPTVFTSHTGAGYLGGSFNSITGAGTISLWLFAPNVTLKNGDVLSFWTRTTDGTYPDRLQVRLSTNGTSVNAGASPTSVGDFTTILQDINPGLTSAGYPLVWTQYTLTLSGLPAGGISGRIAFRYFVTNGGPSGTNSDFIGIDDVSYTTFPGVCSGAPVLGATQSSVTSACPNVPFNLTVATPPLTSGITYQWQSSSTLAGPYANIGGATNATYTVPNQTATTYYQLVATCSGTPGTSTPVQVPESTTCYCIPGATNCGAGDQITNVTLAGINNTTSTCATAGPAGYENYLALGPGQLFRGAANPLSVTVTNGGTEYVGVWVDYNHNGIYEASEYQALGSGPGGTFTTPLNVPASALLGTTRMRVRVKYGTAIVAGTDNCSAYTYGETEDYTVNISDCVPATVTTQPAAQTAACGGNATFTAAFAGSLPGGFIWQVQTVAGGIWTNLTNVAPYSGVNTATLTITGVTTAMNGYNYRLVYSGACVGTSFTNAAALTVTPIAATFTQTPSALCAGGTTAQTINVTGGGTGVFTPNGAGSGLFTDATHLIAYTGTAVTTVYAFPTATTTYTLVRTNGSCVSNPATVTVTVNAALAGTAVVPAATSICTNATGTITVTGVTGGGLTYQWQVSTTAVPAFTNLTNTAPYTGVTTPTLTITNPAGISGNQYRVVVTSASCGTSATSNASTLTVNAIPVVTLSASPNSVTYPTSPVTLLAGVGSGTPPYTYQFLLNGATVATGTSSSYAVGSNAVGVYTVRVTDANGCVGVLSSPVTVTGSASNVLFIYPSPNNGSFQVRYYNSAASTASNEFAIVNVFDSKGSRIFTGRYTLNGPYTQMNVVLGAHGNGLYRVELTNDKGDRLKTGTVMVF